MKAYKLLIGGLALGFATLIQLPYAAAQSGGTSIQHFTASYNMTNSGVESTAAGTVRVQMNAQGSTNHQRLRIVLANLTSNSTYHLQAITIGNPTLTQVVDFATNTFGAANLYYGLNLDKANTNKLATPAALNPASSIRELDIVNASAQTVLTANFTDPTSLQYQIKRNLDTTGVSLVVPGAAASLRIKSNLASVQFKLRATGLSPAATYYLDINNGGIVAAESTDATGAFTVTALPNGSPTILNITSLAIRDSSSNSILQTLLP